VHISVVIPVYNGAAFIQRCLDSVFAQAFPAEEVIVVDDGSTDDTPNILDRNKTRIRAIRQANSGRSTARNAGLRAARGDYVAFLDADDQFWPDHLKQLAGAAESSGTEIVYDVIGPPFYLPGERLPRQPYAGRSDKHLACCRIWTVNAMVRRNWVIQNDIQFDPELAVAEDAAFFWKMIIGGARIGYIRRIGTTIGIHEANTTSDSIKTTRAALAAYDALEKFVRDRGLPLAPRLRRQIELGRRHKHVMSQLLTLHAANAADVRQHIRPLMAMLLAATPTRPIERCRCLLALCGIGLPCLMRSHRFERLVFGFSVSRSRPVEAVCEAKP